MATHETHNHLASALHRNWEEMAASVHTTTRGKYYNAHACRFPQEKWPTVRMAVNGGSAGSLQRSGNPTNILTFVAR